MSRVFFARELDSAASFWRIYRADGVTLGFTTHDRDLRFDGIVHRAAPGMLPSAIRRTIEIADDGAEIEGALTEITAQGAHAAGTQVTLLDDRLVALDPALVADGGGSEFAVIGLADEEPVTASLENAGVSRRPLVPVHPRVRTEADGSVRLCWTRRARGGWAWLAEVEQPLVEQAESYEIGLGAVAAPLRRWIVAEPELTFDASEFAALAVSHPGAPLWVRQHGSYAKSPAILLTHLT